MKKETWSKPELVVLLRNHPEESLQALKCKHPGYVGANNINPPACADNNNNNKCMNSSDLS